MSQTPMSQDGPPPHEIDRHPPQGPARASATGHGGHRLSDLIADIAAEAEAAGGSTTLGAFVERLGDRAFAALLFICGMLNVIALGIPGISTILGAPMMVAAVQVMIGRDSLWLPKVIARRPIANPELAKLCARVRPWILRAERFLQPRFEIFAAGAAERIIGGLCLLLSALIFLPIPLGNALPGLAIALYALAILERDGVFALLGLVVTAISLVVVSGVVYAIGMAAVLFIRYALNL
ncbi:exopolysaccharide biosynthesis protein [Segnochrobactrum spirostomi]|uniref:Exopolysaccharide biosynthesis protein n=1 Tax=Segnochrobactrum spirostomi TaxID=2608987 RepID=A0A6A7XZG1_9HYPH|nr:exopolysaccharide biosynthesis protein [Segnochrobactrum spirostomi]MQT12084.1 exopolysaccharide biosynthesis protein [Segnochrobactrum spirostomi]